MTSLTEHKDLNDSEDDESVAGHGEEAEGVEEEGEAPLVHPRLPATWGIKSSMRVGGQNRFLLCSVY